MTLTNHIHVLLEVPPGCDKGESLGLTDEELIHRIGGLYSTNGTAMVRREIEAARAMISGGYPNFDDLSDWKKREIRRKGRKALREIHERFSYRMHSLSEFFKGMLQRFTCWFNRQKGRRGTLWESRFRSVIVQDGLAARTMAAYIDLNPVRAGIVEDAADYRWSSYGEAVGGGRGAKKAQQELVRALYSFGERGVTGRSWAQGGVGKEYRRILMMAGGEQSEVPVHPKAGAREKKVVIRKGMSQEKAERELKRLSKGDARDLKISKLARCRIRYFTDGAVIGSKEFVNGVFERRREMFGPKRKDGARKPRGALETMKGELWSLRALKEV